MNIQQVVCDNCGKKHNEARHDILRSSLVMVQMPQVMQAGRQTFDFCDEKCLWEFFEKRRFDRESIKRYLGDPKA